MKNFIQTLSVAVVLLVVNGAFAQSPSADALAERAAINFRPLNWAQIAYNQAYLGSLESNLNVDEVAVYGINGSTANFIITAQNGSTRTVEGCTIGNNKVVCTKATDSSDLSKINATPIK